MIDAGLTTTKKESYNQMLGQSQVRGPGFGRCSGNSPRDSSEVCRRYRKLVESLLSSPGARRRDRRLAGSSPKTCRRYRNLAGCSSGAYQDSIGSSPEEDQETHQKIVGGCQKSCQEGSCKGLIFTQRRLIVDADGARLRLNHYKCECALIAFICLTEVHEVADSWLKELDLELNLALFHAKEAEARVEEVRDEATITKDMEEERSYVAERERRVMASYKEFKGFAIVSSMLAKSLMGSSTRVPSTRFKARYLKLEVDEDPFAELPSDAEVPAPTDIPFDNHPATPPALPPSLKVARSCQPSLLVTSFYGFYSK
ncbi:hypothetical protein B296_00035349 [Ensete ventricosum]|uniref:Uncharacterized protein n=1 Tax=Ensete ventricosum TaxID=4639 RepID=A0A426XAG6_ENSVE|nr:hypothetical protein B296_00035349 [Ensete ventricosum]